MGETVLGLPAEAERQVGKAIPGHPARPIQQWQHDAGQSAGAAAEFEDVRHRAGRGGNRLGGAGGVVVDHGIARIHRQHPIETAAGEQHIRRWPLAGQDLAVGSDRLVEQPEMRLVGACRQCRPIGAVGRGIDRLAGSDEAAGANGQRAVAHQHIDHGVDQP